MPPKSTILAGLLLSSMLLALRCVQSTPPPKKKEPSVAPPSKTAKAATKKEAPIREKTLEEKLAEVLTAFEKEGQGATPIEEVQKLQKRLQAGKIPPEAVEEILDQILKKEAKRQRQEEERQRRIEAQEAKVLVKLHKYCKQYGRRYGLGDNRPCNVVVWYNKL